MTRYAVLHHTGVESPHYDLVFETSPGSSLTTFRVSHWPPRVNDLFAELPDHRPIYLDYEGPISGDRGAVARVDGGTIETEDLSVDPMIFAMRFTGAAGTRDVTLMHTMETGWAVASVTPG